MELKFKKLHPEAITPRYATAGAACFDLHCLPVRPHWSEDIHPGESITLGTGLAFEVPAGHVMLVFSRSGHGFKSDVRLANCVGVIDSDYRGEVMVKLRNDQLTELPLPTSMREQSAHALRVNTGDRIAQAMIVPIPSVELREVLELGDTERGAGGFGSTGA